MEIIKRLKGKKNKQSSSKKHKKVCEMVMISEANRDRFEESSSRRVANECYSLFTSAEVKPTIADVNELGLWAFTTCTFIKV
jgi:hypothetical protein